MANRRAIWLLLALLLASALYLAWGLRQPYGFILSLRGTRLAALALVGASVGAATVVFQTIVGNRLLTPGIVGVDAMFVLIQTTLILTLGGIGYTALPALPKFLIEAGCLAGAAMILFGAVLRAGAADMTRLVLTGVILGILLRGLTGFMQRILDPSEFAIAQASSVASFNAIDPVQLAIAAPLFAVALVFCLRLAPVLDVAALGRTHARALGVDHDRLVLLALALVASLVAISTALAGPITFLGLLAASLGGAMLPNWRHALLIPVAALTGALILVAGQFVFERLLGLQSTLAVIVEFLGGLVFLALVLKRRPI
ncbi:iron chelate uptake ABC transporter family permease subunit [Paracoccus sp. M683]|uniref:iron chelate uptake ABC transporter family permease subunit n=1 Tax=Paracoccus sp. M683 TaxID=2594268 RepID=UPI00117D3A1D|nr:iron chelate uptake ABC transporter family permease subunit [Paracoccus sp. M683]TRW97747.1 iron chelate uptake ABC transporter family permease subunit [Paracoccus sp. M683]